MFSLEANAAYVSFSPCDFTNVTKKYRSFNALFPGEYANPCDFTGMRDGVPALATTGCRAGPRVSSTYMKTLVFNCPLEGWLHLCFLFLLAANQ